MPLTLACAVVGEWYNRTAFAASFQPRPASLSRALTGMVPVFQRSVFIILLRVAIVNYRYAVGKDRPQHFKIGAVH